MGSWHCREQMPRLKCSLGGAVCMDGWYVQCQQMSLPQPDRQVASGLAWNRGCRVLVRASPETEAGRSSGCPHTHPPPFSLVVALGVWVTSACTWLEGRDVCASLELRSCRCDEQMKKQLLVWLGDRRGTARQDTCLHVPALLTRAVCTGARQHPL